MGGLERRMQSMTAKMQQAEQRAMELSRAQETLEQQFKAEIAGERNMWNADKERMSAESRALREKHRSLLKEMAARQLEAPRVEAMAARQLDSPRSIIASGAFQQEERGYISNTP